MCQRCPWCNAPMFSSPDGPNIPMVQWSSGPRYQCGQAPHADYIYISRFLCFPNRCVLNVTMFPTSSVVYPRPLLTLVSSVRPLCSAMVTCFCVPILDLVLRFQSMLCRGCTVSYVPSLPILKIWEHDVAKVIYFQQHIFLESCVPMFFGSKLPRCNMSMNNTIPQSHIQKV